MGFSPSPGVCEAPMDVGLGLAQGSEGDRADDSQEEHLQAGALDAPERWGVGGVYQVFRGKMPGIPG